MAKLISIGSKRCVVFGIDVTVASEMEARKMGDGHLKRCQRRTLQVNDGKFITEFSHVRQQLFVFAVSQCTRVSISGSGSVPIHWQNCVCVPFSNDHKSFNRFQCTN